MNRTVTLTPGGEHREWVVTVLKFLTATAVCSTVYAVLIIAAAAATSGAVELTQEIAEFHRHALTAPADEWREFFQYVGTWLGILTAPALPAAAVYLHLPDRTVDRFHALGKVFAMYVPINITLSGLYLIHQYHFTAHPPTLDVAHLIFEICLSSAGLPGIYLGALIAARWAR